LKNYLSEFIITSLSFYI